MKWLVIAWELGAAVKPHTGFVSGVQIYIPPLSSIYIHEIRVLLIRHIIKGSLVKRIGNHAPVLPQKFLAPVLPDESVSEYKEKRQFDTV